MNDARKKATTARALPANKDAIRATHPHHQQGMRIQAEVHSAPNHANEFPKPNADSPTTKVKVTTGKSKKNMIVSVESIRGLQKHLEAKSHAKQHNRSLSDSQLTKKTGQAKKRQRMLQLGRRAFGEGRKKKADGSRIPVRQNSGEIDSNTAAKTSEEPSVKRPLSSTPRKDKIVKQVRKIMEEEAARIPKGSTPEGPGKNVPAIEDCFKSPGGTTTSAIASPLSVLVATEVKDASELLKTATATPREPEIDRVLEGRSEDTVTDTDATKQDSQPTDQKVTNRTEDDLYNEAIVPAKKEPFDVPEPATFNQPHASAQTSDCVNKDSENNEPREGEPNESRSPALEARLIQIHNRKRKHHLPWTAESFRQELENSAKCKKLKKQWLHNVRAMANDTNTINSTNTQSRSSGPDSIRRRTASDSFIECKHDISRQVNVSSVSDDDVFTDPSDLGEGENSSKFKSGQWTSEAVERAIQTLTSNLDARRSKASADSTDGELKEHRMPEEVHHHRPMTRRCSDGQYQLPIYPQSEPIPRRPSLSSASSTPLFSQQEPVGPHPTDQPPIRNLAGLFRQMHGIPASGPLSSEASSSLPDPTPNSVKWFHPTPNGGFPRVSNNFSGGHLFSRRPEWSHGSSQFGLRTESMNPMFATSDSSRPSPFPSFFSSGHPASSASSVTHTTRALFQDVHNMLEKSRDCQTNAVDRLMNYIISLSEVNQSLQNELDLERSARVSLEQLLGSMGPKTN